MNAVIPFEKCYLLYYLFADFRQSFDINYLIQLKSYNCLAESYTILY